MRWDFDRDGHLVVTFTYPRRRPRRYAHTNGYRRQRRKLGYLSRPSRRENAKRQMLVDTLMAEARGETAR